MAPQLRIQYLEVSLGFEHVALQSIFNQVRREPLEVDGLTDEGTQA
jgi:hypothetical protein